MTRGEMLRRIHDLFDVPPLGPPGGHTEAEYEALMWQWYADLDEDVERWVREAPADWFLVLIDVALHAPTDEEAVAAVLEVRPFIQWDGENASSQAVEILQTWAQRHPEAALRQLAPLWERLDVCADTHQARVLFEVLGALPPEHWTALPLAVQQRRSDACEEAQSPLP